MMISGMVSEDGKIKQGKGFKLHKYKQGLMLVLFEPPLPKEPIVVCTLTGESRGATYTTLYSDWGIGTDDPSREGVAVTTSRDGDPNDHGFSFVAICED